MGTEAGRGDADQRLRIEETERTPERVELGLNGELDLVNGPVLRSELEARRREARCVVLSFADVAYVDSTGLVLLIEAARDAGKQGWELALRRDVGRGLGRLLEVTKTEGLFTWVD